MQSVFALVERVSLMVRFILATFAFMAFGFYQLSGGSDFEPVQRQAEAAPAVEVTTLPSAPTLGVAPQLVSQDALLAPDPTETKASALVETKATISVVPAVVRSQQVTPRKLAGDVIRTPKQDLAVLGPEETIKRGVTDVVSRARLHDQPLTQPRDLRHVSGSRVNMRNGPGTQYSVVDKLLRGQEVEVLQDPGIGWVKLQVTGSGRIGWMSARLLQKVDS